MMTPTIDDVFAAQKRLAGKAVVTPLLRSPQLDDHVGGRVLLKAECLQRTGTFKFRGACNAIAYLHERAADTQLDADRIQTAGVVACSSGNHAQGIAAAAQLFGIPAMVVMPEDTPTIKTKRTRALGAEVIFYDRASEDRTAIAHEIARRTGAHFIHPYDNCHVIAGQGTTGLEIIDQAAAMDADIRRILVCTGGGGLAAGICLAVHGLDPAIDIHTVEPLGFEDHVASFAAGARVENKNRTGSVCDALLAEKPGKLTFAITKKHITSGLTVSDSDALAAVRFAFGTLKVVLEPGGAVALAALLSGKIPSRNGTTVVVLTGGNIEADMLTAALRA